MTATRVVNLRQEAYDVYIGRGSVWGNPYTHLPLTQTKAMFQVATREEAIACYEDYIWGRRDLLALLPTLKGKRLGCYCAPLKCHGQVLVDLVETMT